jgi:hypothetical protein
MDCQRLPEKAMNGRSHLGRAQTTALWLRAMGLGVMGLGLSACGGGNGSGALDNASTVNNPARVGGQKLSFVYFQRCVNPVLTTPLPVPNSSVTATCASGGCHDQTTGSGGALRLLGSATPVNLNLSREQLLTTDMYKNYYSAVGVSVAGAPTQSLLLNKPLVRGVLHGGGAVFSNADERAAKTLSYWINRPVPQGQDEFSSAANTMFTPPDPTTGACNFE